MIGTSSFTAAPRTATGLTEGRPSQAGSLPVHVLRCDVSGIQPAFKPSPPRACTIWAIIDLHDIMNRPIEIYDTTLRDGSQGQGVSFSVADKLRIAERLDAFGVHYIEGGWPGSNPKDIEFFDEAKRRRSRAPGSPRSDRPGARTFAAEADEQVRLLLDAETPVVTIFGKTWLLHVREVLQTTPEENLAMIEDTVRYLKQHGKLRRVRRRARVRRLQGRSASTRSPPGRRPSAAAPTSSRCATPTAGRCRPRSPRSRATRARRLGVRSRHPHPRRHRARRGQRAGGASTPAPRTSRARSTATASATGNCNLTTRDPESRSSS